MQLPSAVCRALTRLEAAGHAAYVVGGAVRDHVRGVQPHDFDLCTSARPDETRAVFAGERVIDTGARHGTITVLLEGAPLEITTLRVEGTYSDGRRPDAVRFVRDIEADLARRDFTINAMAFSSARGLIDPFGGRRDLEARVLRAVGMPQMRFEEDALRIVRGLRMMAETGFVIEPATAGAMRKAAPLLLHIAPERISTELLRLLCGRYAGHVLRQYADVLGVVLPEILPMVDFDQRNPHHLYHVFEHTIRVLEQIPAEPALRLAALYHDTGKPFSFTTDEDGVGHFYGHPKISAALIEQRCLSLRLPSALREEVVFIVRVHNVPLGKEVKTLRRRLAQYGESRLRSLIMFIKADSVGRGTHREYIGFFQRLETMLDQVIAQRDCLTVNCLALGGHDLMALGLRGRRIGNAQRYLLEQVLDEPARNTRETLTDLVQQHMKEET